MKPNVHTIESLQNDLGRLGADPSGILMVHVSYKAIGETEGRGDAVLDSMAEYMASGLLLLPGHTWANINKDNPIMDVRNTPTCVGVLPELFRKRPGVTRSLHPTHSLCGLGTSAVEFLTGDHLAETPCGFKTAYRRLYEQNAQILLIGVRFNRNTYIHGVEEWYDFPGRLSEKVEHLYVVNYDGTKHYTPQYRHDFKDPKWPLPHADEEAMIAAGAVRQGKFGDADCLLCDARKLSDKIGERIDEMYGSN